MSDPDPKRTARPLDLFRHNTHDDRSPANTGGDEPPGDPPSLVKILTTIVTGIALALLLSGFFASLGVLVLAIRFFTRQF